MHLRFYVGMDGSVTGASLDDQGLPARFETCALEVAGAMEFPQPTGGEGPDDCVTVMAPLRFRPQP